MGEPFGGSGEGMAAALTASGSFKDGKALRRKPSMKPSLETDEFINLLHGSDPVKVELNRLENEVRGRNVVRSVPVFAIFVMFLKFFLGSLSLVVEMGMDFGFADKDRELGEAQAEIKALRLSERAREKAVEEVIFF